MTDSTANTSVIRGLRRRHQPGAVRAGCRTWGRGWGSLDERSVFAYEPGNAGALRPCVMKGRSAVERCSQQARLGRGSRYGSQGDVSGVCSAALGGLGLRVALCEVARDRSGIRRQAGAGFVGFVA
jgi:hypothetical protein